MEVRRGSGYGAIVVHFALAALLLPNSIVAQSRPDAGGTQPHANSAASAIQETGRYPVMARTRVTVFTSIQGNALSATNQPLADTQVRLRDARLGRIVALERTDKSGLFVFRSLDPGSYIIELLGEGGQVLAASDILNVESGQTVTAVVKLPFRTSALEGLFGPSTASALTVIAAGAAAGVLSVQATTSRSP
jgi:hypothetical protein